MKSFNDQIDRILHANIWQPMHLDFFSKLRPFTAALPMHLHLACACLSIDTNRLIFPSLAGTDNVLGGTDTDNGVLPHAQWEPFMLSV